MRYKFNELFKEKDGALTPIKTLRIKKSVTLGPSVTFRRGVSFAGVDFFDYKEADIEAEELAGMLIVKGFYLYEKENEKVSK